MKPSLHGKSIACLLLVTAVGCESSDAGSDATIVYLVRHAEKIITDSDDDPPLTDVGKRRAEALVGALEGMPLDAVYATQYQRTQQTVEPLVNARKMSIRRVQASQTHQLAQRVKSQHAGQRVLVAAHSNTIPDLVAALGVKQPLTIADEQYGDIFVVTVANGSAKLALQRFGP